MRSNRVNYVAVGSFVIAILVAMVVSMALLAGRTGVTETYYTNFDNVLGIRRGTEVLYQGYRAGQVEGVELVREEGHHRYRVELGVDRALQIPSDSEATVAAGLLAAVTIDIRGGSSSTFLEPGDSIPSREAGDVFAALSGVAGELSDLMENSIRPALGELSERMPEIVANLQQFTEELSAAGARINEVLAPENTGRIRHILENADAVTSDFAILVTELRGTRQLLNDVVAQVDAIVANNRSNVDQVLVDLQYSLESIVRHIDSFNQNLEGTSRNMNEFSRQIRANPALLLGGKPPPDEGDGAGPE